MNTTIKTNIGNFTGIDRDGYVELRGIKYADAKRWEYPVMINNYGDCDATAFGACCYQRRAFEDDAQCNAFYHKEFRAGLTFTYSEDCQFLNIYAPKDKKGCPVLLYIHGGSFTGGSADEGHVDGKAYAERGIVFVAINYRLGPWGFCAHDSLLKDGVCGNYGLADQQCAVEWVIKHIDQFGGDASKITLLGQSAGAMSVDILISAPKLQGKIRNAIMMSGAGIQRIVARPSAPSKLTKMWDDICAEAGVKTMDELKEVDPETLYYAWDRGVKKNPLNMLNTMPVKDGSIVTSAFNKKNIPSFPILLGITITDMMPIALEGVTKQYSECACKCGSSCYVYSFDRLLPGDESGAWHSCDLLYAFATLGNNWRPFTAVDYDISAKMVDMFCAFVNTGNPGIKSLPYWKTRASSAMHLNEYVHTGPLDTVAFLKSTFGNGGAKF